jgi:hypothetical protein
MCCQATCLEAVFGPARIQVWVSATAGCQSCIPCNVLMFFYCRPLTSSWLILRALCSEAGTICPLVRSPGAALGSPGGGLLMPSFSEASEFRLPLALAAGGGDPGFAPFGAPLKVGIWLCGPSDERMSRVTGGRVFVVCEEPFLLDLKRKDIIIWSSRGGTERL